MRAFWAGAAALATLALPALAQPVNSHNSGYFPGGVGLAAANGDLVTLGTGLTLSGGTLTAAGGTNGSAVRARAYSLSTPNGGPVTTTPYYPIPYALLPGTINGAYVMMQAADAAIAASVLSVMRQVLAL